MANNIACYIRLSLADGDLNSFKDESNSIKNQRDLLHQYIETHHDFDGWNVIEFVDDGYTGTNTDRPEFQRMLEFTRQGQIHCIIVKDLSRFARNYVVCGEYIEEVFPFLGVRFIAINDNYDSANSTSIEDNMSMVLKSVLNAYYSKDISRKITASFHQRMKQGIFRCQAPFGYLKGKETNTFQVDPKACKIVRRVFDLALEGKSTKEIANTMNEEKHLTPQVYNRKYISSKRGLSRDITENPLWNSAMVLSILRNQTYSGDKIMRKQAAIVPGSKKRRPTTAEEQIIQKDAHEPIVSHEEYEKVQQLFPKRKISTKHRTSMEYPLKGVVRCGYCKRCMILGNRTSYFVCRHSTLEHSECSPKHYEQTEVENIVLQSLQPMLQMVVHTSAGKKNNSNSHRTDLLLQCQKDISNTEYTERRIKQLKLDLYEKYTSGDITLDEYQVQKDALVKQGKDCSDKLKSLRAQEESFQQGIIPHDIQIVTESAHKYKHSNSLSREMVQTFVDSIYCYETHYEIKWNYQDIWEQFMNAENKEKEEKIYD